MMHPDDLAQAACDKQVRYRHEAYGRRVASHPIRRRLGTHLIHLGEAIGGQVNEQMETSGAHYSRRQPA